ncbi:MAG TPA: FtsX-like permease family protein [Polyangiaceae bacterium]|nr:FtsX-like permease family protein [Polyangiaceae bacterium]
MALFRLIFRLALRNRGRTLITALGVGVTLLAFLMLRTLVANWYSVNEDVAKSDQLEMRHKISIGFVLWKRMEEKVRSVPGVEAVSALIWFSGYYKDPKENFGQLAVEGESYFKIHPEYLAPPDQMKAYMDDRSGALVGQGLVDKHGWKLGDKITLTGTIYPGNWDFTLRAIYPGANDATDRSRLYMHYDHLQLRGEPAHRLAVKAEPAAAKRIDALFANTDTPTKTESQLAVQRSWATWSSGVIAAIDFAAATILVILMLVLGNAMAMATREGSREYATLRAIGYRSRHIIGLVLAEGLLIAALGVALGLLVAPSVLEAFSKLMEEQLGGTWSLELDVGVTLGAVGAGLLAAMLASAVPAWRSGRLRIVDALRKVA